MRERDEGEREMERDGGIRCYGGGEIERWRDIQLYQSLNRLVVFMQRVFRFDSGNGTVLQDCICTL